MKKRTIGSRWSSFLAGLVLAFGASVRGLAAQQEGGTPPAENKDEAGEKKDDEKKDDEKNAKYLAIVGGDVYTGTGAVLRGATVLARNGKIKEIGYDVFLPPGAESVDAHGLHVYPGLIALGATGRITAGLGSANEAPDAELEPEPDVRWDGVFLPIPVPSLAAPQPPGEDSAAGARDPFAAVGQAEGDEEEPKSEIEDTFDPFNSFLVLALATGITSVQQSTAAVKLKRYEIDGVLLSDRHLASVNWALGDPGSIHATRDKFAKAAQYLRDMRAWKERGKKDEKEPSRKGVDTTAGRVLSGEALAYFRASRREELLGIARFAQEFGFRPVIEGCEEGWTVADELGRAGAYAILVPRHRLPKEESFVRPGGASIENAAVLHRAGVQVAVHPDSNTIDTIGTAGRDLLALPVEAGFAVRGGLPDSAALEAMTIVPARVLGIDHRVGSLEVGKDCDAIVTDGDILHYQTFVQYTVVDGKLVYDKEKEIYFAHIRPRPKKPAPAATTAPLEEKKEGEKAEEKKPDEEKKTDEKKEEEKPGGDEKKKSDGGG